jgi:NADH-quinone oxidoreductase subunit H
MNPWLYGSIFGLVAVSVLMLVAAYAIWFERKFAGLMQNRPGPTMVGYAGLLQSIADLLKLLQKEDITPRSADRALFNLAPPLGVICVLAGMAAFPWAPGLIPSEVDVGLLLILSLTSLMTIPVWMAGWSSNNKYALLGGMRAAAQAVSFEVPLLLTALVPVILSGSFRIDEIIEAQSGGRWFIWWPLGPGTVAGVIFFFASLAEANRIPFDIPEAESELVAGITTEYTGMKFGLFYLAEYLHTLIGSFLVAALFLGGWDGPGPDGAHWLVLKGLSVFALIFWIRWTLLRFRADQFMSLCWKVLMPISIGAVALAAIWKVYT